MIAYSLQFYDSQLFPIDLLQGGELRRNQQQLTAKDQRTMNQEAKRGEGEGPSHAIKAIHAAIAAAGRCHCGGERQRQSKTRPSSIIRGLGRCGYERKPRSSWSRY